MRALVVVWVRTMKPDGLFAALGGLEVFIGLGAVFGGAALVLDPSGALLRMPLDLLKGSPFSDYLIPGVVLTLVIGGGNFFAGILALRRHRLAAVASLFAGLLLTGWIVTQIGFIGYQHPIQLLYLVFGLLVVAVGTYLMTVPTH